MPPHDPQENLGSASNSEVKTLVLMVTSTKYSSLKWLWFHSVCISRWLHPGEKHVFWIQLQSWKDATYNFSDYGKVKEITPALPLFYTKLCHSSRQNILSKSANRHQCPHQDFPAVKSVQEEQLALKCSAVSDFTYLWIQRHFTQERNT